MRLATLLAAFFLTALLARAEVDQLRVGVRASVDYKGMKKPTDEQLREAKEHQRIYIIAQVKQIEMPSKPDKLVKPVNELALANELRATLARNGYTEATTGGPKPEIVLLVDYGRGWLPNVYLGEATETGSIDGASTFVPSFKQLMDQKTPGYEEKIQRASYEKLVIVVTAYKYPSGAKEKPQRLWKTIMHVDDPEHRDLNVMMKEMFAAGGGFFGQLNEKEAEVWKPLPEGKVILGETQVIEDPKPEAKPAPKK
ncbi:MAG: hypothetical protein JSS11_12490 [Verrucomicrobia bacterium]|nr:hypothetical protein [Verrucomicrobiota bacterium]